jgi:hypothetical protein
MNKNVSLFRAPRNNFFSEIGNPSIYHPLKIIRVHKEVSRVFGRTHIPPSKIVDESCPMLPKPVSRSSGDICGTNGVGSYEALWVRLIPGFFSIYNCSMIWHDGPASAAGIGIPYILLSPSPFFSFSLFCFPVLLAIYRFKVFLYIINAIQEIFPLSHLFLLHITSISLQHC